MKDADRFVEYLGQRWRAFVQGEGNVPCGSCRGCCRAGYNIGLSKSEAEVIPHTVVEGHAVIMPLPDGACPFLVDEQCSIYAKRPMSCRHFDCRDFAYASVRLNPALGTTDQVAGVAEINASVERFHAEHEGMASTHMATEAAGMVTNGDSAVLAAQSALAMVMIRALPPASVKQLVAAMLGPDEAERQAGMEAADRFRGRSKVAP